MRLDLKIMNNELNNLLVKMYAGSIAYGTNLPTSDVDFRGLFCADPINIRTPFFPIREKVDDAEEDSKYYELSNFMKLCLDCNPNIIELLWTDESDIVQTSEPYKYLRSFREEFLSSKCAFTFSGYAMAQMKRIKGHDKWITNPKPVEPPYQKDYVSLLHNFTDEKMFKFDIERFQNNHRLIPYGNHVYGVYKADSYKLYSPENFNSLNKNFEGYISLNKNLEGYIEEFERGCIDEFKQKSPLFLVKFNEAEYLRDKEQHKQYWDWKENRNEKRSELEEKFGYDTKHGMHLVRLLRMGEEILSGKGVIVKRPDAAELLAIRHGAWTYDEAVKYAEDMDAKIKALYETTKIRKKPDIKLAAKVLMDVQDMVWEERKKNA